MRSSQVRSHLLALFVEVSTSTLPDATASINNQEATSLKNCVVPYFPNLDLLSFKDCPIKMSLDFVTTYSQLINLSPDAPASKFYSTEDYAKLVTLGPSLPALNYPLPSGAQKAAQGSTISIQFKSIKPPFKFTTTLGQIRTSLSIYNIKSQLIQEVDALREAGAQPSNLKFMVKSKVLTDTTTASMIGDGSIITVMVSQPAQSQKVEAASELNAACTEPELEATEVVSDRTWREIETLLCADLRPETAQAVISKWKQELA